MTKLYQGFQNHMKKYFWLTLIGCTISTDVCISQQAKLVGYWKLLGDCKDYSASRINGINHGVGLSKNVPATFNGTGAYIEIPDNPALKFGEGDFSICAWVKCEAGARVVGDIVNKYDAGKRTGINFHIFSSASGYSSVSDSRNVLFGVDNAVDGEWIDCGRPSETNSIITSLIVFKGGLYAGIGDAADPKDACRLFRYGGDGKWIDCGRVSKDLKTPSIMGTLIHKGKLYVSTGKWDYNEQKSGGVAGVYKYLGNEKWAECGTSKGKRIMSIASYDGSIYAPDDLGAMYRYDDNTSRWTEVVGQSPDKYIGSSSMGSSIKFRSTGVYHGDLYGGAGDTIKRFELNHSQWSVVGAFNYQSINQVHTFTVYEGKLYAGTWPDGMITRYESDSKWTDCGWVGSPETVGQMGSQTHKNEINDLIVYNGKMYAGVIPKAEVWRYDGLQRATMIKRLVFNDDFKISEHESWCRVPAMAIYQGKLFAGTSTARGFAVKNLTIDAGKVFRWESGKCISFDDDLGISWKFLAAIREGGVLKLYVDGKLVSVSSPGSSASLNVDNNNPLLIGFGAENYFKGSMKEIRLYSGALSKTMLAQLYKVGTVVQKK